MPLLPTGLITTLAGDSPHPKIAQAYLVAVDKKDGEQAPWEGGSAEIAFQYWPETIQDSRQVEWSPRSIPGGSHPIYQWTHSGERRISFTAIFTRDREPPENEDGHGLSNILDAVPIIGDAVNAIGNAFGGSGEGDPFRDAPIESAISWLRWFTYPLYDQDDLRVFEPAKVMLVMPNSQIGHDGSHDIIAIMTNCEVTYEAFFVSGHPRIVEVALEFAETVQHNGQVKFHSRSDMYPSAAVSGAGGLAKRPDSHGGGIIEGISSAIGF